MTDDSTWQRIAWHKGKPYSSVFQDTYASVDGAIAEAKCVFIDGNHLIERWESQSTLVVAELGFGAGLNFLTTWQEMLKAAPACAKLHYIVCEKYPLTHYDLEKIYELYPDVREQAKALLTQYPNFYHGVHQLVFAGGRVKLTLYFSDVLDFVKELAVPVDAWFLDGFAPKRNPDMWADAVMERIAQLSVETTTLATYSVAGSVCQALQTVGFATKKCPGFGSKRHRLEAIFTKPHQSEIPLSFSKPWFVTSKHEVNERHAIVIGAGIAGCSVAAVLARENWKVTIIEKDAAVARWASGNPAGIVMPHFSSKAISLSRFSLAAYTHALRNIHDRTEYTGSVIQNYGVLQLLSDSELERYQDAENRLDYTEEMAQLVSAARASVIAGVPLSNSACYFSQAISIDPAELCRAYLDHENIELLTNKKVCQLQRSNSKWHVVDENGSSFASSEVVVIANAYECSQFSQTKDLPLQVIRGQLAYCPVNAESEKLSVCVTFGGYIMPENKGVHIVGASYDLNSQEQSLSEAVQTSLIEQVNESLPSMQLTSEAIDGRVAFRAATPDKLPMVGPVPDVSAFRRDYEGLCYGRKYDAYPDATHLNGLYISVGHGSKGLSYSALAAEVLGAYITDMPMPLERDLVEAINPARFIIRKLKRREL